MLEGFESVLALLFRLGSAFHGLADGVFEFSPLAAEPLHARIRLRQLGRATGLLTIKTGHIGFEAVALRFEFVANHAGLMLRLCELLQLLLDFPVAGQALQTIRRNLHNLLTPASGTHLIGRDLAAHQISLRFDTSGVLTQALQPPLCLLALSLQPLDNAACLHLSPCRLIMPGGEGPQALLHGCLGIHCRAALCLRLKSGRPDGFQMPDELTAPRFLRLRAHRGLHRPRAHHRQLLLELLQPRLIGGPASGYLVILRQLRLAAAGELRNFRLKGGIHRGEPQHLRLPRLMLLPQRRHGA